MNADEEFGRRLPIDHLENQGNSAASVPLHRNEDGLPIGVQFVAPYGDEAALFRIGSALERAAPWANRRPPIHAG